MWKVAMVKPGIKEFTMRHEDGHELTVKIPEEHANSHERINAFLKSQTDSFVVPAKLNIPILIKILAVVAVVESIMVAILLCR